MDTARILVLAAKRKAKLFTPAVTATVTEAGSSIRPASTDVRITAGTAAQQTTTMLRTVTAMEAGAARAAASIAAP